MVKKIFGSKENGESKKYFGPKIFWVNKFLVRKIFVSKKLLGQKKFWIKNYLGQKKFGSKKFWVKNNFGQEDLGLKISLSKKMQVGLIQGGGFLTPPHPENSRVKIVLGCC